MTTRIFLLWLGIILYSAVHAEVQIDDVSAQLCVTGEHKQPNGPYALYVFCDDALGTNVAVFLKNLGAPFSGDYDLGKRFWQAEEWSYDVTSYAWLEDNNYLLLATSGIYGSGAVYLLDLESQSFQVKLPPQEGACLSKLQAVSGRRVEIEITNCEDLSEKSVEFAL